MRTFKQIQFFGQIFLCFSALATKLSLWSTIRPNSVVLVTRLSTAFPRYTVAIGPIGVPRSFWDVALVDCLDVSCKTHLRPYSVDQSPDQLFLRHSIWWYHPPTYKRTEKAKKKVSRLWMMTRTVSLLKQIAIDAGKKYDLTLFSTVKQRFFQFYRLILRNAFFFCSSFVVNH